MLNAYDLYKKMKDDEIILAFEGDVTDKLLSSVFSIMESKFDDNPVDLRIKKKMNNILVECLQNVIHHAKHFKEAEDNDTATAIIIICKDRDNTYRIVTGNHILNSEIEKLKNKIDKVNALTKEELKKYYRDALSQSELSEKGGAGLGMIHMARQSGSKMDYQFDAVNQQTSFFSLMINIT